MARKNKKNKRAAQKCRREENSPKKAEQTTAALPAESDRTPKEVAMSAKKDVGDKTETSSGTKRGVSVPVCVSGMILTLLLGLYLGSQYSGVLEQIGEREKEAPSVEVAKKDLNFGEKLELMASRLETMAAERPGDVNTYVKLAGTYLDLKKPAKAAQAYEKALELTPDNPDLWSDLGVAYKENGEFQRAAECFHKALSLNPAHVIALYNEGVTLSADLRDNDGAIKAWETLLKYAPDAKAPDGTPIVEMIKKLR